MRKARIRLLVSTVLATAIQSAPAAHAAIGGGTVAWVTDEVTNQPVLPAIGCTLQEHDVEGDFYGVVEYGYGEYSTGVSVIADFSFHGVDDGCGGNPLSPPYGRHYGTVEDLAITSPSFAIDQEDWWASYEYDEIAHDIYLWIRSSTCYLKDTHLEIYCELIFILDAVPTEIDTEPGEIVPSKVQQMEFVGPWAFHNYCCAFGTRGT